MLGLTWARWRERLARRLDPAGMRKLQLLERGVDFIRILATEGFTGVWRKLIEMIDSFLARGCGRYGAGSVFTGAAMHEDSVREDDFPSVPRKREEVARRTLALFAAVSVGLGAPREEVVDWLVEEGLLDTLSPRENAFLSAEALSEKDMMEFSWHAERLAVLLWALHLGDFPAPDRQSDTRIFQEVLPPFAEVSTGDFLCSAKLRSELELERAAEMTYDLHSQARSAKCKGGMSRQAVDLEIVQEHHHACNWLAGYEGLEWDEVTTDT